MKIIVIRGIPGTGKTSISRRLLQKLGALYINIDTYKIKAKTGSFKKDCIFAYNRTLEKLEDLKKSGINYVILDEIFDNKNFIKKIKKFSNENKFKIYWFQIKRSYNNLLKTELKRKRKLKNSLNDLKDLQKALDKSKIKNEVIIENNSILLSSKKILRIIKSPNT